MGEKKTVEGAAQGEKTSPVKYFISGGFGGICTVLAGHPLDTIKVRLQTMPPSAPGQAPMYSGTFDCAAKTVRNESIRGLYKGMAAPLAGVAPIFAISFFGFGVGKRLFGREEEGELSLPVLFAAGAFSGIFTTAIMAPGERIKCLLQIQQGQAQPKYSGPKDVVRQLYREGGLRSIFKGTVATLMRDVPASGMYFMTYEWLQKRMKSDGEESKQMGILKTVLSGGMAGILNWVVAMPADVIKSRLQTSSEGTFRGIGHVFSVLMKEEGPMALYKGVTPVMLRAFPANAACFLGFEACMSVLNTVAPNL